jgi:hypothetical protein
MKLIQFLDRSIRKVDRKIQAITTKNTKYHKEKRLELYPVTGGKLYYFFLPCDLCGIFFYERKESLMPMTTAKRPVSPSPR